MPEEREWKLSSSQEDYLESIAALNAANGHAHTKEIAERLDVKMPSVSAALRNLAELGLVFYQVGKPVRLTAVGNYLAQKIILRHQTFLHFFQNILGLDENRAERLSREMKHLIDHETEIRFLAFMDVMENWDEARQKIDALAKTLAKMK